MKTVPAPAGYEGCRYFDDAAREWMAAYRHVGDQWWTNAGYCGHAHIVDAELDTRATAAIERRIAARADQGRFNAGGKENS